VATHLPNPRSNYISGCKDFHKFGQVGGIAPSGNGGGGVGGGNGPSLKEEVGVGDRGGGTVTHVGSNSLTSKQQRGKA
jgi:hypothetical protein